MGDYYYTDGKDKATRTIEAKNKVEEYSVVFITSIIVIFLIFVYLILHGFVSNKYNTIMPDLYAKTYQESVNILKYENNYNSGNIYRFPQESQSYWNVCGQYPKPGEEITDNNIIIYLDRDNCEK